jgi:hypothetical protein
VATSEQNAKQLGEKSAQASESTPTSADPSSTASNSTANNSTASNSTAAGASHAASTHAPKAAAHPSASQSHLSASRLAALAKAAHQVVHHLTPSQLATLVQAAQQAQLKQELAQSKTVLLLFWNPKSSDDVEVRKQMQAVAAHLKGKVAAHVALPNQVGQYGSVTRDVQIFQTPTLLIVDKQGLAITLTGLVDQYAIEQGILEAQKVSSKA